MIVKLVASICAFVAAFCVGPMPTPANADGNATGGGWTSTTPNYSTSGNFAREDVWTAYDDFVYGRISYSQLRSYETNANSATSARSGEYNVTQKPECDPGPCPLVENYLAVTHKGQSTNYYCGPATGVMVADFLGKQTSAATGQSLTQVNMANSSHMKTDANGQTSWYDGAWTTGINQWLKGTNSGYYGQLSVTPVKFRKALRYNIDNEHPFNVHTVEFEAITGTYNGHQFNEPNNSNQAIGHWLTARGYSDSLDKTYFRDPASTVWSTTSPSFAKATKSMVNTWVPNGIVAG